MGNLWFRREQVSKNALMGDGSTLEYYETQEFAEMGPLENTHPRPTPLGRSMPEETGKRAFRYPREVDIRADSEAAGLARSRRAGALG